MNFLQILHNLKSKQSGYNKFKLVKSFGEYNFYVEITTFMLRLQQLYYTTFFFICQQV